MPHWWARWFARESRCHLRQKGERVFASVALVSAKIKSDALILRLENSSAYHRRCHQHWAAALACRNRAGRNSHQYAEWPRWCRAVPRRRSGGLVQTFCNPKSPHFLCTIRGKICGRSRRRCRVVNIVRQRRRNIAQVPAPRRFELPDPISELFNLNTGFRALHCCTIPSLLFGSFFPFTGVCVEGEKLGAQRSLGCGCHSKSVTMCADRATQSDWA